MALKKFFSGTRTLDTKQQKSFPRHQQLSLAVKITKHAGAYANVLYRGDQYNGYKSYFAYS